MREIIGMELHGKHNKWIETSLPLTDYELLDVIECLGVKPGEPFKSEICSYNEQFVCLSGAMRPNLSLVELNVLARKLAELSEYEACVFAGLVAMEMEKRKGPCELSTLINYAYSTDCCEVVAGVKNGEQLGRFYFENDFFSELANLPDNVASLLSFETIGKKTRLKEGGVFTRGSYVVQTRALKEAYEKLDLTVQ